VCGKLQAALLPFRLHLLRQILIALALVLSWMDESTDLGAKVCFFTLEITNTTEAIA